MLGLFDHLDGGCGHLCGIGAHDLAAERMVFVACGDVVVKFSEVCFGEAASSGEDGAVEEGFGDAVGAAVAASDDAHGGIGVSGEACLEEGGIESWDDGGDARVDGGGASDGWGVDGFGPGGDGGRGRRRVVTFLTGHGSEWIHR